MKVFCSLTISIIVLLQTCPQVNPECGALLKNKWDTTYLQLSAQIGTTQWLSTDVYTPLYHLGGDIGCSCHSGRSVIPLSRPHPSQRQSLLWALHRLLLPILGLHVSELIQSTFFCVFFWDSAILLLVPVVCPFLLVCPDPSFLGHKDFFSCKFIAETTKSQSIHSLSLCLASLWPHSTLGEWQT